MWARVRTTFNSWLPRTQPALLRRQGPGGSLGRESQIAGFGIAVHQHGLAIADAALQQQPAERGFDLLLNGALQRTRAIVRVLARTRQVGPRRFGQLERDAAVRQARAQPAKL